MERVWWIDTAVMEKQSPAFCCTAEYIELIQMNNLSPISLKGIF